ncbi:chemotaxis protein [Halarcobacter mediterraneus]|uniref:Chemotaxis protein n=1 Tax=Halarcobacter mediterraneus TaxID=2023153 RepID=A0A4Q1B5F4_9BACT|nr:methyl-accepting chemotaxis protein [Halarcobacter mediterraneus]RXK13547.1 chemotaxis protein [Halarcobacter mediterraneus]
MKKSSILKRSSFITILVTVITLLISFFILNSYKNNIKKDVYLKQANSLKSDLVNNLQHKFDVGISNAISISNDGILKEALSTNNRDLAIKALAKLSKNMKNHTPFKNIKVHIHTKDNHSFLRNWKVEKFGDDLSSFRDSVVKVNSSKTTVNTFEVGKAGLSIRSVVPIINYNKEHLGSLEFMQGVNSVAKIFDKRKDNFLLLMDNKLAVAKLDEKKQFHNYTISQKFINKEFLDDANKINIKKLLEENYLVSNKYLYTYTTLKDFNNKEVGIALVARPLSIVNVAIDKATFLIFIALIILVIALLTTMFINIFNMKNSIITPIKRLKKAIDNVKEDNSSKQIPVGVNDEIGQVVSSFNEYLDSIEKGLRQDRLVIDETKQIIEKVNSGLYNDRIKQKADSEEINSLVTEINNMIDKSRENLTILSETLVALSKAKYDHKIPNIKNSTGMIASLISGTKVTQSTMNEVMALIDSSNRKLTSSADELTSASQDLSNSSNEQAAALEETAAAIEEITSTINQSNENTSKMAEYAKKVTISTQEGKNLATQTSKSMDELNEEVTTIHEAITVIDQIAFQTNILSLNAAVEAATAGEAGKGFAVVAGEVRNLANRSAEAAKQIKELVDSATQKAKTGKNVAGEMIHGYNELNHDIETTIELITSVTNATKEQNEAMNQINDTVNSLDKATQQNASLASNIYEMAHETKDLALQLQDAVNKTSFDANSKKRICEPNLIFDLNSLKSDHINFKNMNFNQCAPGKNFTVKNHHECDLGKWIDQVEKDPNQNFSKMPEWEDFKNAHEKVHSLVQKTVNLYGNKGENKEIFETTEDVEKNINLVFDYIDKIRENNCS